ncbi:hypothetical protein GXW82_02115 [Streptacidiphilus sp. 4-A2]|nr:hypothetical protein [Streptacidiphilus sp. 4-A2]
MRLDRLPDLIGYLSGEQEKKNESPVGSAVRRVSEVFTHSGARRAQAQTDLFAGGFGELPGARTGAEQAVRELRAAAPEGLTLTDADTGGLTGLVMHLAAYVLAGQGLQAGANAKSIAGGLMARTDFAHNFRLLPAGPQAYFREHPDRFAALVLSAAHQNGSGDQPLFGAPVERGLANNRTQTAIRLTRQQWLQALPQGHDLLKNVSSLTEDERTMVGDEPGAEAVHKSLGALGDQPNSITTKRARWS